jgi:hypothetical protein
VFTFPQAKFIGMSRNEVVANSEDFWQFMRRWY